MAKGNEIVERFDWMFLDHVIAAANGGLARCLAGYLFSASFIYSTSQVCQIFQLCPFGFNLNTR